VTVLGVVGCVLLLAAAIAAVFGRLRLWGRRLGPASPSDDAPRGSLLLASRDERGAHAELVPLLADWQLRGVLRTEAVGPALAAAPADAAAPGPVWRFTAGPAIASADAVETIVLGAILDGAPSVVVEREDVAWRDRLFVAVSAAVDAQRAGFRGSRRRLPGLRAALIAVAVLAAVAWLVGAVATLSQDLASLAWLAVLVPVLLIGVVLVTAWPSPSTEERRYLQAVRDLRAWVRSTEQPIPALGGWAMIWNLPGHWSDILPKEVTMLRHADRAFVRGDLAQTIPEPFSLG
jgi:hypothetical protein